MLSLFLTLALYSAPWLPSCPSPDAWLAGQRATKAERSEAKRRYGRALKDLGLDREARIVAGTIAWGESRWDPCSVHRLGRGEDGLGLAGTFVRLHLESKWETGAPREDLYVPEVAALVVVRTMRRIQRWHRAGSWRALNRIYAGHREEWRSERWCERLAQRGVDCRRPISKLGTKLGTAPEPGQRLWVARMALGGV